MEGEVDPKAFWDLSYGLYVVTSRAGDKINGQIATAVIQACAEPALVVVCIHKGNLTHSYIEEGKVFGVSILEESTPMNFIGLFGFKSGRDVEKLAQVEWRAGPTGAPLVTENALSVLDAAVVGTADAVTHTIFIGEVVSSEKLQGGRPLTYAFYHERKKGTSPKHAPTYRTPETRVAGPERGGEEGMDKYVCDVCGYVYDPAAGDPDNGVASGTAFEKLPDGWLCPVCGASKDQFSKT